MIALWTALFLTACTYSPEEEYFKDIKKTESPNATITLNEIAEDHTIYVYGANEFSYSTYPGIQVEMVEILFDGQVIFSNYGASGRFYLNQYLLTEGTHELMIRYLTASGSGSLADKIGAEKFQVWRTWKVEVDLSPPTPPDPVLSKTANGILKISWTPCTRQDFISYQIYLSENSMQSKSITITNSGQTSYLVDNYVGGYNLTYSVYVETRNGIVSGGGTITDYVESTATFNANDSTFDLSWDGADYAGAFKSYTISVSAVNGDVTDLHEINDVSITHLRIRPPVVVFGLPLTFWVRTNALHDGYSPVSDGMHFDNLIEVPKLPNVPNQFVYNTSFDAVVGYNPETRQIYMYDDAMQTVSQFDASNGYASFIPEAGKYIYTSLTTDQVVQRHLETGVAVPIDLTKMSISNVYESARVVSASKNQIVALTYVARNFLGLSMVNHSAVYDMVHDKLLYHSETNARSTPANIPTVSPDGKYLHLGGSVFLIQSDGIHLLHTLSDNRSIKSFRADNPEEIIAIENTGTIRIIRSADGAIVRSINAPGYYAGYDPVSGYTLWIESYKTESRAIHIDTQTEVPVALYTDGIWRFSFVNRHLIHTDGSYFPIIKK